MRFQKLISATAMVALLSSSNFATAESGGRRLAVQSSPESSVLGIPVKLLQTVVTTAKGSVKMNTELKNRTHAPFVEQYLLAGKLADGEDALLKRLNEHKTDDQLRFGLGVLQFLRGVERLSQDLYRFGLRDLSTQTLRLPILRLPVPCNPNPQTLTYQDARTIAETFRANLVKAEATLALVRDCDVKLPLHFGLIRMDRNGDGQLEEDDTLWKLYASLSGNTNIQTETAENFYISFDCGDVHWLRGYCHLLSAMCDIYLAYDTRESFDHTAHLFFTKVDSPYPFLSKGKHVHKIADGVDILDLIAVVHLIRWKVIEPQRMEAALHHFEQVVAESHTSWKLIMAETDDDHEWLPNPRQTGVIPNVRVTDEMVTSWSAIMSQIGKILAGELLIPFWRGADNRGVNVRKVFLQPPTFDLVLWVQGPGAAPYLEKGELSRGEDWRREMQAFGAHFPGFALWFN